MKGDLLKNELQFNSITSFKSIQITKRIVLTYTALDVSSS